MRFRASLGSLYGVSAIQSTFLRCGATASRARITAISGSHRFAGSRRSVAAGGGSVRHAPDRTDNLPDPGPHQLHVLLVVRVRADPGAKAAIRVDFLEALFRPVAAVH